MTKNKYLLLNFYNKTDQLNVEDIELNRIRFSGSVMTVNWRSEYTKFDIYDYVKISKKQRSHEIERKEKKLLNYIFVGICIALKKNVKGIDSSFVIRNVFDSFL